MKVLHIGGLAEEAPIENTTETAMSGHRGAIAALVAVGFAFGLAADARSQAYPSTAIKIVTPNTAGSPVDVNERMFSFATIISLERKGIGILTRS